MTELYKIFRNTPQEIIGERLYYAISEREFDSLKALAEGDPNLQKAVEESVIVSREFGPRVLVPVTLIQKSLLS